MIGHRGLRGENPLYKLFQTLVTTIITVATNITIATIIIVIKALINLIWFIADKKIVIINVIIDVITVVVNIS